MVTASRKTSFIWSSRLLAGAVFLFPYSLSKVDFRSLLNQGLSVSAHKASPAYAAFEDLNLSFKSEMRAIPDNGTRLAAGQTADVKQIKQAPQGRILSMRGLTIRAPAELKPQPIYVAEAPEVLPSALQGKVAAREPVLVDHRGHLLPLDQRKKMLMAQLKQEDWAVPSAATRAQELAELELQDAQHLLATTTIRSHTGTPITISRPLPPTAPRATAPDVPTSVARVEPAREETPEENYVASMGAVRIDPDNARPLWLNGQIEMTGGLAFVGPETRMTVTRVFNGEVVERGRIWISEGRFEIFVKRPVGYLVAELQTSDGRVLGRGEINLVHMTETPVKNNRIADIRLALRPTAEGATFRTTSGYSHGQQALPITDARVEIRNFMEAQKVNDEGVVSESALTRDSSFVVRAVAKKHWASVVVGQARRPQDIQMFANTLVEALVNLQLKGTDRKEALHASVVWGQVNSDTGPVADAEIEMAGNYRAIYLNEMYLPDPSLRKTSKNGLFAFLQVKSGVQALRVKSKGRLFPAQIFPTEDKNVSYVQLHLRNKVVSQFRIFDVLDIDRPVNARMRLVGTDEMLPVNGQELVEYAMAADPFMVEAEGGPEYEVSRTTMTGSPHLVQIPLVRRDWLYNLYTKKEIALIPGRGMIAGFIDDQGFEVEMTGYPPQEAMQIVYFDGQGNPIEGRTGVAGGGFVIFNAPLGLQTVYIHPTQSREAYSQVVVAEPEYVHVLTWSAASSARN